MIDHKQDGESGVETWFALAKASIDGTWRQRMCTDTQISDRCASELDTFLRIDQLGHFELIKKGGQYLVMVTLVILIFKY